MHKVPKLTYYQPAIDRLPILRLLYFILFFFFATYHFYSGALSSTLGTAYIENGWNDQEADYLVPKLFYKFVFNEHPLFTLPKTMSPQTVLLFLAKRLPNELSVTLLNFTDGLCGERLHK